MDDSVDPETTYTYKIEAYNDVGTTTSNELEITTPEAPTLIAPTNLQITIVN